MRISSTQIVKRHLGQIPTWIRTSEGNELDLGRLSGIARESLAMGACLYYIENSRRSASELVFETENREEWGAAKQDLELLFHFLTKRNIVISFVNTETRSNTSDTYGVDRERRDVSLFSGGCDSLCGALQLSRQNRKLALVHSMTSTRMESKAEEIHRNYLGDTNSPLFHVESRFQDGYLSPSYPQLRSTMFLMNAFPFLEVFNSSRIFIPENGPMMINPPISGLTVATQSTRPEVLSFVERILTTISAREVRIDSPFKDKTKAEIIASTSDIEAVRATSSCFNYRWGRYKKMCGNCFGCNITRLSMFANGIRDTRYENNPFEQTEMPKDPKSQRTIFMYSDLIRNCVRFSREEEIDDEISLSIRQAERFYSRETAIDVADLMKRFGLDMLLGMRKMYDILAIRPEVTILGRRLLKTVPKSLWPMIESRRHELHSLKEEAKHR